jgi:uncharacterized protein YcfL
MLNLSARYLFLFAAFVFFIVGCSSVEEENTNDDVVFTTRISGGVSGILVEQDGCLRLALDSQPDSRTNAIVWQRDVFEMVLSELSAPIEIRST